MRTDGLHTSVSRPLTYYLPFSTRSIKDDSFFSGKDSAKTRILQAVQACQAISKYTLESARTAPTSPTLTKTRRASFGPLEHHFHNHHLSLHPALDKQFKAHVISGSTGRGGAHEGPISILLKPANLAKEGGEGDHAIWVVKGEADAQWVMPYSSDNDHDLASPSSLPSVTLKRCELIEVPLVCVCDSI
jgi:hypothetical protein